LRPFRPAMPSGGGVHTPADKRRSTIGVRILAAPLNPAYNITTLFREGGMKALSMAAAAAAAAACLVAAPAFACAPGLPANAGLQFGDVGLGTWSLDAGDVITLTIAGNLN